MRDERGFTIVELLIVIIVIAILAAITIVAYTNISTRAKASTAKSNAESVQKVVEAYAADDTTAGYPTLAQLTAYNGLSKLPTGITVNSAQLVAAAGDGKTIQYVPKTGGGCIGYWDASLGTPAAAYVYAGNASTGSNVATPTCG
ncbi:prepilin-type N-terminal cleavage/methylation domain-containing protein [Candidatus Saccharibacteria bacterium]|nr:prepilin-type N-terminal cleavage/methylation domain-containing protein [Candidatus Saccharibacteria bacterium]